MVIVPKDIQPESDLPAGLESTKTKRSTVRSVSQPPTTVSSSLTTTSQPLIGVDDYIAFRSQVLPIQESFNLHFRKTMATISVQTPANPLDVSKQVIEFAQEIAKLTEKPSGTNIIEAIKAMADLASKGDWSKVGDVLKAIGNALSKKKEETVSV